MSRHAVDLHGMPCLIAGPAPYATPKATVVVIITCRMTWHFVGVACSAIVLLQRPLAYTIRNHLQSGFVQYSYMVGTHKHSRVHGFATTPQGQAYNDCIQRYRYEPHHLCCGSPKYRGNAVENWVLECHTPEILLLQLKQYIPYSTQSNCGHWWVFCLGQVTAPDLGGGGALGQIT
jgi:hypothetical protein